MKEKIKSYAFFILTTLAVGGLAALLTRNNMSSFEQLEKGPIDVPAIVFPIVWTVLYILMGISAATVFNKSREMGEYSVPALRTYVLQLAVNFFWSIIFFNMQNYLFAFIWLLLLLVLVAVMIFRFEKISPVAAYLQIPYFLWVSFAGYLNFMVWILNK